MRCERSSRFLEDRETAGPSTRTAIDCAVLAQDDAMAATIPSSRAHVEQSEPVLQRLQAEAAENQQNAEGAEIALRKIVGIVLDIGIYEGTDGGGESCDKADANGEEHRMIDMVNEGTADQCSGDVADGAHDCCRELLTCEARTAVRHVIHRGTYAAGIGDQLPQSRKRAKGDGEAKTHSGV